MGVLIRVATVIGLLATVGAGPATAATPDSLASRNLPTVREGDAGLPTHTIYRPADLTVLDFDLPILLWENGGCFDDNADHAPFLSRIAAAGFVVLADGPPEGAGQEGKLDHELAIEKMQAALEWALAENQRPGSKYFHRLDPTKIAPMGYSCGGITAFQVAARDPRIKSMLGFNADLESKFGDTPYRQALNDLHIPLAWINGGPTDPVWPYAEEDWSKVLPTTPAYMANHSFAGHVGFWETPVLQDQLAMIAINWLDYTLVSGNSIAGGYLLDNPCGFCGADWSTRSKNWAYFVPPA